MILWSYIKFCHLPDEVTGGDASCFRLSRTTELWTGDVSETGDPFLGPGWFTLWGGLGADTLRSENAASLPTKLRLQCQIFMRTRTRKNLKIKYHSLKNKIFYMICNIIEYSNLYKVDLVSSIMEFYKLGNFCLKIKSLNGTKVWNS